MNKDGKLKRGWKLIWQGDGLAVAMNPKGETFYYEAYGPALWLEMTMWNDIGQIADTAIKSLYGGSK